MRVSRFFISTLKEAPSEAELISHKLMIRAGLIKRLGSGIYTLMPLGLRVVRRVEFDHALADEARARGVAIREATRVTDLAFERSGVRIETTAGSLRARAVVGADGVGSFVRRASDVEGAPDTTSGATPVAGALP